MSDGSHCHYRRRAICICAEPKPAPSEVTAALHGVDLDRCDSSGYFGPRTGNCTPDDPCRLHLIVQRLHPFGVPLPGFWSQADTGTPDDQIDPAVVDAFRAWVKGTGITTTQYIGHALSAANGETEDAATRWGDPAPCCEATVARAAEWLIRHGETVAGERLRRQFPWPNTAGVVHPAQQLKGQACECAARKALVETHRHTWDCVKYAATTGQAYCIDSCVQSLRAVLSAPCPCEGLRQRLAYIEDSYERAERLSQVLRERSAYPAECPITGRKFFMTVTHPERGEVATYGGPFDSYTIPEPDEDGHMRSERHDHDAGNWVEGGEPERFALLTDAEHNQLWEDARQSESLRDDLAASRERERGLRERLEPFAKWYQVILVLAERTRQKTGVDVEGRIGWQDIDPILGALGQVLTRGSFRLAADALATPEGTSLLRPAGPTPRAGCYCQPGRCMAPVVMGFQTPCRDPEKAAATPEGTRDPRATGGQDPTEGRDE